MVRARYRGVGLLAVVGAVIATPAIGQTVPVPPAPPTIGAAELEAAKALLAQAQQALQAEQYQVLQRELVEAEGAFQRFAQAARAAGKAAEVARGAEALTAAQRVSQIVEGLGAVARTVGPPLVALAMLYPSPTATQEQDYPSWMRARDELEVKLRQVAADSRRVAEEIEAARKSAGQKGVVKAPGASSQTGSSQPTGDPPCRYVGSGGPGPYRPKGAPPDRIRCTYKCGDEEIEVIIIGKSEDECERPEYVEQARRKAERRRQQKEER